MGFEHVGQNVQALVQCDGDLNQAIELLLSDNPPPRTSATPQPAPVAEVEEDDGGDFMATIARAKKNKKTKKTKPQATSFAALAGSDDDDMDNEESEVEQPAKPTAAASEDEDAPVQPASKNNKKKKNKSSGGASTLDEPVGEAVQGKPKKGAPIAALQKMMEEQRRLEEQRKREEEEEQRRIEEEERLAAEAEAREAAEREAKREATRLRREQMKREGLLLTKKQKEAKTRQEQQLKAMLAAGVKIAGLSDNKQEGDQDARRGGGRREAEERKRRAAERKRQEEEGKKKAEEEAKAAAEAAAKEEDASDDWEALLESGDEKDKGAAAKADDGADSWEQPSSDEEEEEAEEKSSSERPATAMSKDQESSESESDSESDSDADESDSGDGMTAAERQAYERKQAATARRQQRMEDALAARSADNLRSPICCILGHVDTGKCWGRGTPILMFDGTTRMLLDKIRQTNVQDREAGGITQQIGATYFPADAIQTKTASVNTTGKLDIKVPGLLIIDTPGHESFSNLRSRGSSLCNIAILVVDIMHGLEPQTLESLRLLRDRKAPFIVALNKIDRIYGWKPIPDGPFRESLRSQSEHAQREFDMRAAQTITAFAEQGLNAKLYYENKNFAKFVSLVPTSAITGEGIPDLLALLVGLTQQRMSDQLMYLSELECTVLEVKVIEGLGTTIDVILSNGVLNEGDRIVVCGLDGPIVTNIRALLTPQPMRELRVKSAYVHHKSIKAAMGVKISAPDLEKAIAGSRLLVVGPDDDEEEMMDDIMSDLASLSDSIDKSGKGVYVQASTLGSLEALLEFLRVSKIPVAGIGLGPVHKKNVTRASVMLERAKEFAVMLCFDVKIDKDAQDMADEIGLKVFTADIIYHLFDQFTAHNDMIVEQKRKDQAPQAIFPCILKMIKGAVFNKRDPLILGVDIIEGQLRTGTPVCVVKTNPETKVRETISLGKVVSMEINHKHVDLVRKGEAGGGVAVRIECPVYDNPKTYGRHFDDNDQIYSQISRTSIDVLKESFRNDLSKEEWGLVIKLKKLLEIN
ncbi:P-loop containing nucleoside triphosphate hydrolase protein [Coemansia spiralis]|nr:P-loop containing nucleoside triphosphate hydrolase protein [Coemansia spiralis]